VRRRETCHRSLGAGWDTQTAPAAGVAGRRCGTGCTGWFLGGLSDADILDRVPRLQRRSVGVRERRRADRRGATELKRLKDERTGWEVGAMQYPDSGGRGEQVDRSPADGSASASSSGGAAAEPAFDLDLNPESDALGAGGPALPTPTLAPPGSPPQDAHRARAVHVGKFQWVHQLHAGTSPSLWKTWPGRAPTPPTGCGRPTRRRGCKRSWITRGERRPRRASWWTPSCSANRRNDGFGSESRHNRTARSRSSSGYFFGAGTRAFPPGPQNRTSLQRLRKTGGTSKGLRHPH
jgi:hypothetical protein